MERPYRCSMKPCCVCGVLFEPKRDKSYRCAACKSEYNRAHYIRNKSVYVTRASRRKAGIRDENTALVIAYLASHPCIDCGEADPLVLEFDHLRDKKYDIGRMVSQGLSWSAIRDEIKKCEVRCANCHRRVTAKRGGWARYRFQ